MKILSLLNISNPSNLLADSGFIFQKLLLEELSRIGHEVALLAPERASCFTSIPVLPIQAPLTKYHARMQLGEIDDSQLADEWWLDPNLVILCNQPELAFQIKAYGFLKSGREVPIVSYIHYLPFWESIDPDAPTELDNSLNQGGLGRWIKDAIGMAIRNSDACIVGSEFGRQIIELEYGKQHNVSVVPPPIEPELKNLVNKSPGENITKILYNHRIYGHYGTTELFNNLKKALEDHSHSVRVIVTAPASRRSPARRKLDIVSDEILSEIQSLSFVDMVDCQNRSQYLDLISSCHFGIGPIRRSPLWSMAIADLLGAGRPAISLALGGYPEVLADYSRGICINSSDFCNKLIELIEEKPKPCSEISKLTYSRLSPEVIASKFLKIFESIL